LGDSAYRASLVSGFANGWSNFGVRNAILPLLAGAVVVKAGGDVKEAAGAAGLVLAVFAAGNAIGLTVAGRRTDRVGRRPFILAGLVVSGLATLVTGWATSIVLLVIVCIVAGLGAGVLNPAQQASLADVVGNERNGGPAIAAVQMSSDLGSIIGPILAGVLVDKGSFGLAFAVTGIITLLATGPWLKARETLGTRAA
jgi:MFS family permease